MFITSCSDDNDEPTPEPREQEEAENSATFWNVVGQLIDPDDYTADYDGKTFEPTIGEPDATNPLVRLVAVNDMATAAYRFAQLVDAKVDENTASYEYKNDAVGTLNYTKTNDGRSLATVDVNIRQMPKLQQIIYRNGDQLGENGSFEGAAYYRFGDVVSKMNKEGKEERWICVRPAFGPEKKEDSHWVCIDNLYSSNLQDKSKNGMTWKVPTKLGVNKEHMRNLAELIFALLYPSEWAANLQNDPKLTVFHDFSHKNLKYHTAAYWQKVCQEWDENSLFAVIFGGQTNDQAKATLRKAIADDGLNFLYNGYEWSWFGNKCTLFQANYSGKNLKNEKYTKKEADVSGYNLDFTKKDNALRVALGQFFGDDANNPQPRWVVRHATGKDLASSGYSVKTKLNGCTEVVRYYESSNSLTQNEVRLEKPEPEIGDVLGRDGKVYGTAEDVKLASTTPIGVVVYKGENADDSFHPNATILVMALEDVDFNQEPDHEWMREQVLNSVDKNSNEVKVIKEKATAAAVYDDWKNYMKGLLASAALDKLDSEDGIISWITGYWNQEGCDHYVDRLRNKFGDNAPAVSNWFMPTATQMLMACRELAKEPWRANSAEYSNSLAYYDMNKDNLGSYLSTDWYIDVLTPLFSRVGTDAKLPGGNYWLCTQMPINTDWDKAWYYQMGSQTGAELRTGAKTAEMKVRPFLAIRTR